MKQKIKDLKEIWNSHVKLGDMFIMFLLGIICGYMIKIC